MQFILTNELSDLLNFPTPIIHIVRDYFETYSDVQTINFGNAINTIQGLTNNRIGIGFDNGVIGVYDLMTNTIILNKTQKYVVSSLCQLNENQLVCGYSDLEQLMMWNLKDNAQTMIVLPSKHYCKKDSIILLEKNVLMYNSTDDNVYVINLKHSKAKINQVDDNTKCFLSENDQLFMGYGCYEVCVQSESGDYDFETNEYDDDDVYQDVKNQVAIYNVEDYIGVNLDVKYVNKFTFSRNIKQLERIDNDNFACLDSIFDGHCCSYFCKIYFMNIGTDTRTVFINEQECDNIISISYLGNNNLALHRYNRIEIYDTKTKVMIQQINTNHKATYFKKLNNKFIVVDSTDFPVPKKANNKSCVRIYQRIDD